MLTDINDICVLKQQCSWPIEIPGDFTTGASSYLNHYVYAGFIHINVPHYTVQLYDQQTFTQIAGTSPLSKGHGNFAITAWLENVECFCNINLLIFLCVINTTKRFWFTITR